MADQSRFYQAADGQWYDSQNPAVGRRTLEQVVGHAISLSDDDTQERLNWLANEQPEAYQQWLNSGADLKHSPQKSDFGATGKVTDVLRGFGYGLSHAPELVFGATGKSMPEKVLRGAWGFTPFANLGRGMEAGANRKYGDMATNLALAGVQSATMGYGTMAREGGLLQKVLGRVNPAGPVGTGITAAAGVPFLGTMVSNPWVGLPLVAAIPAVVNAFSRFTQKKPTPAPAPATAGSVLPGRATTGPVTLTPEQQVIIAKANQNRTDASGASGPGGGRDFIDWRDFFLSRGQSAAEAERLAKLYQNKISWTPEQRSELETYRKKQASAPASTTTTAPTTQTPSPGLLPLTPEQLDLIGQQRLAAEKAYDELLNMQKMQKSRAQQQYTQDVQELQRQAAGMKVDLAGDLTTSGMEYSPAAAFGMEQMVQTPLVSGSSAARKGLDQYLADLVEQQKRAKAQRDMTMLEIKKQELQQRAKNTFDQQTAAYGGMLGR